MAVPSLDPRGPRRGQLRLLDLRFPSTGRRRGSPLKRRSTWPISGLVTTAPPPVSAAAQDDARLRKLAKLDDNRPLSPAELYRALNDALDEGYDLFDLSNREARFALILMGGLNAALVIVASQSTLREQLSPVERQIEGSIIGVYALLALAFLLQAIAALRPGQYRPQLKRWPRERGDLPKGVRYYEDVVAAQHRRALGRVAGGDAARIERRTRRPGAQHCAEEQRPQEGPPPPLQQPPDHDVRLRSDPGAVCRLYTQLNSGYSLTLKREGTWTFRSVRTTTATCPAPSTW